MKKCITFKSGIDDAKFEEEAKEEEEESKKDELDRQNEFLHMKNEANDEKWDEVQEKQEEGDEEEVKQEKVNAGPVERLPRVNKPVGDILEDLMLLEIGESNVEALNNVDLEELDKLLQSCTSRVVRN